MSICEAAETFGIPQLTWVISYMEKEHHRLQLVEKTQCFQRLLKILQTYMFILFI